VFPLFEACAARRLSGGRALSIYAVLPL